MVSSILSTPPESVSSLASNEISLLLSDKTGSRTAPDPFPPSTVIETTFCISNFCGSTCISLTLPVTTGLIKALVLPTPGLDNSILGGDITS